MSWVYTVFLNAMDFFSEKMQDVYNLLIINPETYRGGILWDKAMTIFQALLGAGFTIILICGYLGIFSSIENIYVARKPEILFMIFGMVTIAGGLIAVSPELLLIVVKFCQGIIKKATGGKFVFAEAYRIPNSVINATNGLSNMMGLLMWVLFALAGAAILFTTFTILLMAYGRIFKLYIYIAIAPLTLACCASKATQRIGIGYVKIILQNCLEGLVIVIACMMFAAFNDSYDESKLELTQEQEAQVNEYIEEGMSYKDAVAAVVDADKTDRTDGKIDWSDKPQSRDPSTTVIMSYLLEQSFLFMVLASLIKASEKEMQRIFG